jgi:hypothetical protein
MKKYFSLLLLLTTLGLKSSAQNFCDSTGNVVIFSNYDGGTLNINVDMDIPNLKIGICGYENDSIIISGAYVNNITQVIFAGYYNSNNIHCSPWPSQKSINGVLSSITQIVFLPPTIYFNPNGDLTIVCNYSCDVNSSQGGCNTADQVASYFFSMFGSTNLLFHYTQYGCWNGTYNLSAGGNCCAVPITTGIAAENSDLNFTISPNHSDGRFLFENLSIGLPGNSQIEIIDVLGNQVFNRFLSTAGKTEIDLTQKPKGIYLLKYSDGKQIVARKIVLH